MAISTRNGWLKATIEISKQLFSRAAGRNITASSTLTLADSKNTARVNSASATTHTIPNDTTVKWSGDVVISLYQKGVGVPSFAGGSGVTLRAPASVPASVQYSVISAMRVGPNEWTLI